MNYWFIKQLNILSFNSKFTATTFEFPAYFTSQINLHKYYWYFCQFLLLRFPLIWLHHKIIAKINWSRQKHIQLFCWSENICDSYKLTIHQNQRQIKWNAEHINYAIIAILLLIRNMCYHSIYIHIIWIIYMLKGHCFTVKSLTNVIYHFE